MPFGLILRTNYTLCMNRELPEHIMQAGKFKGKVIDNSTRRSLQIVNEDELFFYIDNFFHANEFYSAKIPKNSIDKVIGQRFSFGKNNPFVNHAQVRFIMKSNHPVELYEYGAFDKKIHSLRDFVYSIEVVGPKGQSWSFGNSFGDFVSAHRLCSIEEVVFERVVLGGYNVIQSPPLILDQEKLNKALDLILRRGHKSKMTEKYYLVNLWFGANNCTSEIFYILDELKRKDYNIIQKFFSKLLWRFPFALRMYLRLRGAIDHSIKAQTLNEEFDSLAKSDKLLSRKDKIRNRVFIS